MKIELHPPMRISARLLPAVQIGTTWISLEAIDRNAEGRIRYRYYIDGPPSCTGDDLCSGVGAAVDYPKAMGDLLSFLGAGSDAFPKRIRTWAATHEDEIDLTREEIENPEGS